MCKAGQGMKAAPNPFNRFLGNIQQSWYDSFSMCARTGVNDNMGMLSLPCVHVCGNNNNVYSTTSEFVQTQLVQQAVATAVEITPPINTMSKSKVLDGRSCS